MAVKKLEEENQPV